MAAGKNEKNFFARTSTNNKNNILGKLRFANGKNVGKNVSVDGHFVYNGKLYLVEIDSGNYAKLIAGQYVLLNILLTQKPKTISKNQTFKITDCVFLVIHYYKKYNVKRTINALNLVSKNLKQSSVLDFKVFHESNILNWNDLLSKL